MQLTLEGDVSMVRISQLASLEVINLEDGRILGMIDDLQIDLSEGRITAIIIPAPAGFWGFITGGKDCVIPWRNVTKIGEDVILVRYREGGRPAQGE